MATAEVTPTHQVTAINDVGGAVKSKVSVGSSGGPSAPLKARRRLGLDDQGQFTYKNTPSSTLMASLQLGLQHSIGGLEPKPRRDILMTDFEVVETVEFPAEGSGMTPAHKYSNFTFKTYSPEAFRFFREAFGILAEDYLLALCDQPLRELINPGASGSLFYLSADDAFIMKTVQKKEAKFLQKLLPGYYLNLTQNKRTLLPKFFGLYRYKCGTVNIRIVVMNNLLPSNIKYHEKYDLKGSTYKRRASPREQAKKSPTYKDLDFVERHEESISLSPEKYDIILKTVERDCKVLESFGIMDYSLLMGVHNIDQLLRERAEAAVSPVDVTSDPVASPDGGDTEWEGGPPRMDKPVRSRIELSKNFSIISVEDIPMAVQGDEQSQAHTLLMHYPEGYIQGRIQGDRVAVYLGVIDILQSYRLKKKFEHTVKSFITDGNTVSVHNPSYYARRFQDFLCNQVFRREKVKFRTRKNSALVQSRGRKQQVAGQNPVSRLPGPPLARIPEAYHRQSSKEFDPRDIAMATSPSHRTQQVFVGSDSYRRRALSETVATARPSRVPELPTLEAYRPTALSVAPARLAAKKEDERSEEEEKGRATNLQPTEVEVVPTEGTEGGNVTEDFARNVRGEGTEGGNETEDFARNVRGASTPISNGSPTMESKLESRAASSQTFNDTATSGVAMVTEEQKVEVGEGGKATASKEGDPSQTAQGTAAASIEGDLV